MESSSHRAGSNRSNAAFSSSALAPFFSWLWIGLKDRQPSSPAKFAYGLLFAGLGFLVVAYAASLTGAGRVSPFWLIAVFLLHTIGELCLSPVGLSTVTKLAPARFVGLMMGVFFLSISLGNYSGGWVAGFFQSDSEGALVSIIPEGGDGDDRVSGGTRADDTVHPPHDGTRQVRASRRVSSGARRGT